jgi:pimeloyl-ACP methyl ester carboxylesterase
MHPLPSTQLRVDGFAVPVWICSGAHPRRIVVTSHGLTNDHGDAPMFAELRNALNERDDTVLVEFDYPGSGAADGELSDKHLSLLRKALIAVVEHAQGLAPNLPLLIVARSMGGTVALGAFREIEPDGLAMLSPPFRLVENLGRLRGDHDDDGNYPLPPWAAPSGQVKGALTIRSLFYEELPEEERRLRDAAHAARNVLLVASTEDPKVPRGEMDQLWEALDGGTGNRRHIFVTDHNYESVRGEVVALLVDWLAEMSHGHGSSG